MRSTKHIYTLRTGKEMKRHVIWMGLLLSVTVSAANAEVDGSAGDYDYDYKAYSAAGCGAANFATVEVRNGGGIFNKGTAVNNITCPVIVDRSSPESDYSYLTVFRASGAGTMSCYLNSQAGTSFTTSTQNVSRTGTDTSLYFSRSGYLNSAVLGCVVPAKARGGLSGIKYYSVYEY
jgi:hypothetical protein